MAHDATLRHEHHVFLPHDHLIHERPCMRNTLEQGRRLIEQNLRQRSATSLESKCSRCIAWGPSSNSQLFPICFPYAMSLGPSWLGSLCQLPFPLIHWHICQQSLIEVAAVPVQQSFLVLLSSCPRRLSIGCSGQHTIWNVCLPVDVPNPKSLNIILLEVYKASLKGLLGYGA